MPAAAEFVESVLWGTQHATSCTAKAEGLLTCVIGLSPLVRMLILNTRMCVTTSLHPKNIA